MSLCNYIEDLRILRFFRIWILSEKKNADFFCILMYFCQNKIKILWKNMNAFSGWLIKKIIVVLFCKKKMVLRLLKRDFSIEKLEMFMESFFAWLNTFHVISVHWLTIFSRPLISSFTLVTVQGFCLTICTLPIHLYETETSCDMYKGIPNGVV